MKSIAGDSITKCCCQSHQQFRPKEAGTRADFDVFVMFPKTVRLGPSDPAASLPQC